MQPICRLREGDTQVVCASGEQGMLVRWFVAPSLGSRWRTAVRRVASRREAVERKGRVKDERETKRCCDLWCVRLGSRMRSPSGKLGGGGNLPLVNELPPSRLSGGSPQAGKWNNDSNNRRAGRRGWRVRQLYGGDGMSLVAMNDECNEQIPASQVNSRAVSDRAAANAFRCW